MILMKPSAKVSTASSWSIMVLVSGVSELGGAVRGRAGGEGGGIAAVGTVGALGGVGGGAAPVQQPLATRTPTADGGVVDAHGTTLNGMSFEGQVQGPASVAGAYDLRGSDAIQF